MKWKHICSRFPTLLVIYVATATRVSASLVDHESSQLNLPKGYVLKDGEQFEYIVVGAGAAGSAAAARLALAGFKVLLVEAGGDPDPLSWVPPAAVILTGTATDWHYKTISNNQSCLSIQAEQCYASRGKCLGGSTSINNMIYTRGNPRDWDSFDIPGWAWKDIKPYFHRYEGLQDLDLLPVSSISYHNTSGTMKMQFFDDPGNPWHSKLVEGYLLMNFPYNPDVNAESQIGVTQVVGYVYDGERMSTARGYLSRDDVKKTLKVAKNTRCIKVIIDNNNVAKGITVVTGFLQILNVYATREVILSAGTIATPQILMLSGIGHGDHLKSFNIPVRADLPVGDTMYDHVLSLNFVKVDGDSTLNVATTLTSAVDAVGSLAEYVESRAGPLGSNNLIDINLFANTLCYDYDKRQFDNNTSDSSECELPTMQIIHYYVPKKVLTAFAAFQRALILQDDVMNQLKEANKNYALIQISPIVLQPKSTGQVRLASTDPFDNPAIFPNLISSDGDIEEMTRALRILEDLMETRPFKQNNASLVRFKLNGCPSFESDSEGYRECYARHLSQLIYHAVGTSAIGRVVDEKLRVFGIKNLRVADLSVLPYMVRGTTAASAIAVGERLVDFLMED